MTDEEIADGLRQRGYTLTGKRAAFTRGDEVWPGAEVVGPDGIPTMVLAADFEALASGRITLEELRESRTGGHLEGNTAVYNVHCPHCRHENHMRCMLSEMSAQCPTSGCYQLFFHIVREGVRPALLPVRPPTDGLECPFCHGSAVAQPWRDGYRMACEQCMVRFAIAATALAVDCGDPESSLSWIRAEMTVRDWPTVTSTEMKM